MLTNPTRHMDETHVVTCFLRNHAEVLLLKRSERVGSYPGLWGGVAGHAEEAPDHLARQEIAEETGLESHITPVRAGEPFSVTDSDLDTEWVVHPYLFDCDSRDVEPNEETTRYEWVSPIEIRNRKTVPDLWTAYERVGPTVESIASDRTHGASYLSVRALEHLRDVASDMEITRSEHLAVARELCEARPSMTGIANRVGRLISNADGKSERVLQLADSEIERALTAREDAGRHAAAQITGQAVLTLSRSGSVRETLAAASPEAVYVAESRPGGEGVQVAEALDETTPVTLLPDSAIAHTLWSEGIDAVLVGADTVLADGRLINKVGTRGVALVAAYENVPVYAVTAADSISPDATAQDLEPSGFYDGDADLSVIAPMFDVTPADRVTVITEDGPQSVGDIEALANQYRSYREYLNAME